MGPGIAREGTALISTAIGSLMEDAASEAIRMTEGEWQVIIIKADKLKAVGSDVAALAEAMAVLARRANGDGQEG